MKLYILHTFIHVKEISPKIVALSLLAYGGKGWDKLHPGSRCWFSVHILFSS